jgi:hypothetical protein
LECGAYGIAKIDHLGATGEAKLARALASPSGLASGTQLDRLINICKTISAALDCVYSLPHKFPPMNRRNKSGGKPPHSKNGLFPAY